MMDHRSQSTQPALHLPLIPISISLRKARDRGTELALSCDTIIQL